MKTLFQRWSPFWTASLFLFVLPFSGTAQGVSDQWKKVIDRTDLTAEEREGARFAASHLHFAEWNALPPGHQKRLLRYAADHRNGNPSLVLCWQKDTPSAIVDAFLAVEQAGLEVRRANRRAIGIGAAFQGDLANHWQRTATQGGSLGAQGQSITVTWSFVPDGTIIPGGQVTGESTNGPSNLRSWLAGLYGGSAAGPAASQPWFPIFQAVFDNIAAQTGIRYVYEPADDGVKLGSASTAQGVLGVRGDVRISGHALDGNSNVLAYNYFPDFSEMVIDTSDNFFNTLSNNSQRLRNVVEHEHGHGLGLNHVCPVDNTKLMEPYINLNFTGIQFDEVYTLQRLYSDQLEVHDSVRDNDTFAKATPVNAPVNVPFIAQWIGIDDNSDTDFFKLAVPAGSQLSVRVIPSPQNYLEGAQNQTTGNCTAGTAFNSSILHNLAFDIIDTNQSTVLATANSQPAGVSEMVLNLPISRADNYYIRVLGGSADFNQLYRLEIEVAAPSVAMQLTSTLLVKELFKGQNGVPDPGETVELQIGLKAVGLLDAGNVTTNLVLPSGSQGFQTAQSYGNIASGATVTRNFIFAMNGTCGQKLDLTLQINADGDYVASAPLQLTLGAEAIFFSQKFDTSSSLPTGWTSAKTSKGSGWSISTTSVRSSPNAAFASDPSRDGSSTLTTPSISIGAIPGKLSFFHYYNTESGFDGGVLEIKIGSGAWQDILTSGGSFIAGGYNLSLSGTSNPLSGRSGWSGNSSTFIETQVALPSASANQNIQLRWVIGSDNTIGSVGWFVDDVTYRAFTCDASGVALTLSSSDTTASELSDPVDTAQVQVSALLPVVTSLPVTLQTTGTANPAADLTGFGNLLLASGSMTASRTLIAVNDGLVEGVENLQITSPDATGTVNLTVYDSPYGTWAAAGLGTTGSILPTEDFDGDGSSNVEELIFGTNAASATSKPATDLVGDGADFSLFIPLDTLPLGIVVDAESSLDLQDWSADGISRFGDRFRLDGSGVHRFLRLKYLVPEVP